MSRLLAWCRLLRLSNAPTAVADVWMGYAVATGSLQPSPGLILLTLASLCLYHGGMSLNDTVDADQDASDNRGRPLAAGSMTRGAACRLAYGLLVAGVLAAAVGSWLVGTLKPMVAAMVLMVLVVAYNSRLKRTHCGPVLMGLCRSFNVLLGVTIAVPESTALRFACCCAVGLGLYIVGVTLYARDESTGGRRGQLAVGLTVSVLAILWLAIFPAWIPGDRPVKADLVVWAVTWGVVALVCVRGMVAGLLQPKPAIIGRGVGIAIQGLVVVDASLAALHAGPMAGLAILALLPIALLLSRSIPPT